MKKRAKKSAKFERCVRSVKKGMKKSSRARVNPWAVCHAAMKKGKKRARRDPSKSYRKIWFSKGSEHTAGLIVTDAWIAAHKTNLVSDASRLFPMHEARKMGKFHASPAFPTWEEAFAFEIRGSGLSASRTYASANVASKSKRRDPKTGPSKQAWEIVHYIARESPLTHKLAKHFGLNKNDASYILGLAPAMFGPGGKGEEAYARSVERVLRGWWKTHVSLVPRRDRRLVNRPTRHFARNYEGREIDSFLADLARVEKAPLADRKEGARHFAQAMGHDPELVAERVGWLLDGNYGQGSYIKAREVARSPRMNRVAWLTQTVGALEWQSPWAMTRAAWKKLTKAQKDALDHAVMRALKSHLQEGG